jgi:ubiquinone/menaquinone biosynthesis C-methylase UbiE
MSIVFDRAASFYDQTRGLPKEIERWLAQVVHDQAGLRAGSNVLEIGVGTGRIALPIMRMQNHRYVGIDLSRSMMNVLRAKAETLPIALVQADVTQLPFGDHTFDAVVAVHVFHLISGWEQALAEVERVLRTGGMLLHGFTQYAIDAPIRELWFTMAAYATVLQDQPRAGLLERDEIEAHLEQHFGTPQVYASPVWSNIQTAHEVIDQFEARIWSATWSLSDEALSQTVEEGRSWAQARLGDLDIPFLNEQQFIWHHYKR